MRTQAKDSLKKSAIIIFFLITFVTEKIYIKNNGTTFLFLYVVKKAAICNNAFRSPRKGHPHTAIHFFINRLC